VGLNLKKFPNHHVHCFPKARVRVLTKEGERGRKERGPVYVKEVTPWSREYQITFIWEMGRPLEKREILDNDQPGLILKGSRHLARRVSLVGNLLVICQEVS